MLIGERTRKRNTYNKKSKLLTNGYCGKDNC